MGEAMEDDPAYQKRVGFVKTSMSMNSIPKGTIIVWGRGQCGYSSGFGHIEIAPSAPVQTSAAGIRKTCGSARLFMPTKL
jgi:hypothetical protein